MKHYAALVGACLAIALAGCGSAKDASKGNFEKIINAHHAKDCILVQAGGGLFGGGSEFPVTVELEDGSHRNHVETNERRTKDYAALVKAGLLAEEEDVIERERSGRSGKKIEQVPTKQYTLTDTGKQYFQAKEASKAGTRGKSPGFCVGHYKVDEIKRFTEPGSIGPYTVSEVSYLYSPKGVPDWARDPSLQEAFPNLADRLQDGQNGTAALMLTNEGWVHEKDFRE